MTNAPPNRVPPPEGSPSGISAFVPARPLAILHVCTTCRRSDATGGEDQPCAACPLEPGNDPHAAPACAQCGPDAQGVLVRLRPGARLLAALRARPCPPGVEVRGVECLSACGQGCAVALSGAGRWTYVYGRLDPDHHAPAILDGAARYAATADGLVPWRDRPEIFRKQSLARIPPQE